MPSPDVLIIGGGVIGCSIAYSLAREGVAVTLLERDALAAHASGAAAGMLAPICESSGEGPFFDLGFRSLAMYPQLVQELRGRGTVDPHYLNSGLLRVARTEGEEQHLRSHAAALSRLGLEWLDPMAAREREPLLTPDVRGAVWSPREGHVVSPLMTKALAEGAAACGASIQTGVAAEGLLRIGDRITGVRTAAGDYHSGHVVVAGGAWSGQCLEDAGFTLPVVPVRGQILSLQSPTPPLQTIVWGEEAYLVPKQNGAVVVGATEERVGFDERATAAGLTQLLQAAPRLVPRMKDAAFLQAWAGLRPDTPDHLPMIGPLPGLEGLVVATGHFRNGVLLSPVTGRLVTDWILRGEYPLGCAPFLPARVLGQPAER